MRVMTSTGNTLYFVDGDHLSSNSLVTDRYGNKVSEQKYKAFGETRDSCGTSATN